MKERSADLLRQIEKLNNSNLERQGKIAEISQVNNDLSNLILNAGIGVLYLDNDMIIRRFTPSMQRIVELSDSDIGRPVDNLILNLNYPDFLSDVKEVMETLAPKELEIGPDNGQIYWMRILPNKDINGRINGAVVTFTDITELEQKKAEADRFKKLFNNINSGIYVLEILYNDQGRAHDGKFIEINNSFAQQTGIARETSLGKKLTEIFPKLSKEFFQKLVNVSTTKKPYIGVEYSVGLNRFYRLSVYSFEENCVIVIFDDISSEVATQNKLKESEEKFRSLFNNMVEGICICAPGNEKEGANPGFSVESVNKSFVRLTGLKSENILGKSITEVIKNEGLLVEPVFWAKGIKSLAETEVYWNKKDKHLFMALFPILDNQLALVIQDITKEKNELLARNHLASIVETSEDAIYSVNINGEILTWNKGAEKFYEYAEEEILGRHVSILEASEDSKILHKKLLARVKSGKRVKNHESIQKTKSGRLVSVALTKSPIKNDKNEVIAVSNVVTDMSKIKKREKQLIEARQRSEEAMKLKTAFFQNISHEIRTPMNSVIGYTELLKSRIENDASSKRYVSIIEESGRQLLRLIDDILDISRLDAGETFISKSNFNIEELLQQSLGQFQILLKNNDKERIDIRLKLPENDRSEIMYSDRNRIQQIIDNLLSNAVKYTDEGYIEFGYTREKEKIIFFVSDTGMGMKKEDQKKIFDRFQRIDSDTTKTFSGAGLGLSISRGLAKRLQGEIWCDSRQGEGSTFYLKIPYEINEDEENVPSVIDEEKEDTPNLKGKTILIAEDDEFSSMMLEAILQDTGATLILVKDGNEAVEKLKQNDVDIALLDIRLPGKTGFKILEEVKKGSKTRFIAQTAYAMPENKKEILDAGFDEFLEKPLTSKRLFKALK